MEENSAAALLRKLLKHYYQESGELLWAYHDGVTLAEVDPDLNEKLISFLN